MTATATDALAELRAAGVGRGALVGLAIADGTGLALALADGRTWSYGTADPAAVVDRLEHDLRPRWVWWSQDTPALLVRDGVRVATCWDVAAVHRLLFGGWRNDPARAWAATHALDVESIPVARQPDLFDPGPRPEELEEPVGADGHLRPEWVDGAWAASTARLARWAALAVDVAARQQHRLGELQDRPRAPATARAESTAELLCAELAADGLPLDRREVERLITAIVGPRPGTASELADQRAARDADVLRHAPPGGATDLRNPDQVRSLLRRIGIEVPDTRAWRLDAHREEHPLVDALLVWRKAERVSTTYGFDWLDEHVGSDGRLRGSWSASDGAAGRMTATVGLHNMPADLRSAVVAEPGHVFVRADLGQIEPRVLAAVSGDARLAAATRTDDMYAPVAEQLGVDRPTAKVAVLGAMYGQTTGHGAQALRRLEAAYPVAMGYLAHADVEGQVGRDVRTVGGRLVHMGTTNANEVSDRDARRRAAARGRYARNAMVQGAAAELFKMWAVTVRARGAELGARIVLCLHDELLVHTPADRAEATVRLVDDGLQEAASRWAPDGAVRFVADISTVERWSDAKS
jgi:DNA polymerase-1